MEQTKTQAYANALYEHFDSNSEQKVIQGEKVTIWTGSLTKACAELKIPRGTERRAMRPLEAMDCLRILQRGVGQHPTILVLHHPPTEELWAGVSDRGLTGTLSHDRLVREVRELQARLGGANVGQALADHEARIRQLEAESQKVK